MSQQIYRHVLRDAWSVTWRHPALWFLGAFALFMGQSQFFYSLAGLFKITALSTSIASTAFTARAWYIPIISPGSGAQLAMGLAYGLFMLFILLAFVFMVIQSQGAILAAGDQMFRKQVYSFKEAWAASLQHFWGIVGILFIKVVAATFTSVGIILLGQLVNSWPNAWWPRVVFVLAFVILALFDILVTFVSLYATCFVVLEKQKIRTALMQAVSLFAKHWLASLEIGVIFLISHIIVTAFAYIIFMTLLAPLIYLAGVVYAITGLLAPAIIGALMILAGILWFILAVYTTWFFLSIVILFDHMISDSPVSKIVRFLRSLVSR